MDRVERVERTVDERREFAERMRREYASGGVVAAFEHAKATPYVRNAKQCVGKKTSWFAKVRSAATVLASEDVDANEYADRMKACGACEYVTERTDGMLYCGCCT